MDQANPGGKTAPSSALEFLLLSSDYRVLKPITQAVQQSGGRVSCAVSTASGQDYLRRRRFDAVVVDLETPRACDFIASLRASSSSKLAMVFGCTNSAEQRNLALKAGATYALPKPLNVAAVLQAITAVQGLMQRERRRYFRHAMTLPVLIGDSGSEQQAVSLNLSEGGMAVRIRKAFAHGTLIRLRFSLPTGVEIDGKGEVTWSSEEGMMGIRFHFLKNRGQVVLAGWLDQCERSAQGK